MRYSLLRRVVAVAAVLCALAGVARAGSTASVGAITIRDPWARASMGQAGTSAVYMTLEARGDEGDRLVAAASPLAASAALHTHIVEGGVAKMRPVAAIEIAPGAPTVLEPGGLHIMLVGLDQKLVEGGTLPLTLTVEHAGSIELEAPIRGMAAGMSHGHHRPRSN
jgi:periplasmic copper chaperone A